MDKQQLWHYAQAAIAMLVLWLPSLINALKKYPKASPEVDVLEFLFDVLSIHPHSDSPGSVKLPFTRSKPPIAVESKAPVTEEVKP